MSTATRLGVLWLLAALGVATTTVWTVIHSYTPVLFWDQWADLATILAFDTGEGGLADLLALHNEHSILVPRLFALADYFWSNGTGALLITASVVLRVCTCAVLMRVAWRATGIARGPRLLLLGATPMLLLSAAQIGHFNMGFEVQFAIVFAAATAAAVTLVPALAPDGSARVRSGWIALCFCACAVAIFSASNGMLLLPLVLLFVWAAPLSMRTRIAVTAAAIGIGLARWGVGFRYVPVAAGLRNPLLLLHTMAWYLGAPWWPWPRAAHALGYAGLGLGGMLSLVGLVRLRRLTPLEQTHLFLLWFVLGTAVAVGVGRLGLPAEYVLLSRYAVGALLFWTSAIALALHAAAARGMAGPVCIGGVGAACLAGLLPAHVVSMQAGLDDRVAREPGELAFVVGAYAPKVLERLYWDPGLVLASRAYLRERNKTSFATRWAAQLHRPMSERYTVASPGTLRGAMQQVQRLSAPPDSAGIPAVAVRGWAWDAERGAPPALVLLVDEADIIRGFARPVRAPQLWRRVAQPVERAGAWHGYAFSRTGDVLRAFAVRADGRTITGPLEVQ